MKKTIKRFGYTHPRPQSLNIGMNEYLQGLILENMTEEQITAWLAALIDGEGTIRLAIGYGIDKTKHVTMMPYVLISNKCSRLLNIVKDFVGAGNVYRDVYTAQSKIAIKLLERVFPYLVVKEDHAAAMLDWYYTRKEFMAKHRGTRGGPPHTREDILAFLRLRELNKTKVPPKGKKWELLVKSVVRYEGSIS